MIAVIDYGIGNIRSVQKAFAYVGFDAVVTSEASVIRNASHAVLPGVGSFSAGISGLHSLGLYDEVNKAVSQGKPLLGICLGMQMLFQKSFEGGEHDGFGFLNGSISPFPRTKKVPHVGWNSVLIDDSSIFKDIQSGAYFYFVHSYFAGVDLSESIAKCNYILDFTAAARNENVWGVQFHPEKSGDAGLKVLRNFGKLR